MSFNQRPPPMGMPPGPPMMQNMQYNMMQNRPMGMMGMGGPPMNMMNGPPMGMGMQRPPMGGPPMMPQQGPPQHQQGPPNMMNRPPSDGNKNKHPTTTVFVGNIIDKAPDMMIRQMLQRCGNVIQWKRVQGASGKLQAFGFCEFEDPEATLRCIRLLNDWIIAGRKLVVKVDAKTKGLLSEYKKKKKKESELATGKKENGDEDKKEEKDKEKEEKEEGEQEDGEDDKDESDVEDTVDEMTLREDRVAKAGLEAIMKEYERDLEKLVASQERIDRPKEFKKRDPYKDQGLTDMDLDAGQLNTITDEIKKFRDSHKGDEKRQTDEDRERERERISRRKRELEDQEKERERRRRHREEREQRERDREQREKRDRDRDRNRERGSGDRDRGEREDRERERDRGRGDSEREREPERRRERSGSRSDSQERFEDEEEGVDRRLLERKLREKEAQYQERLRLWEQRERKKVREYEKELEKEEDRRKEERKEAKRLKEFLEDYDDTKDDAKYYRGSALQRRLKEREKEMEADARDRQREREEVEELKRQLLARGGDDVDDQIAKLEAEKDAHLLPRMRSDSEGSSDSEGGEVEARMSSPSPSPSPQHTPEPQHTAASSELASPEGPPEIKQEPELFADYGVAPVEVKLEDVKVEVKEEDTSSQDAPAKTKHRKLTVAEAFAEEERAEEEEKRRRKLVPLDYDDDLKRRKAGPPQLTAEEKRMAIKKLIEQIPTVKEDLFLYPVDWPVMDSGLMEKRIKPWITKKIVEYIGEEEPSLTDFICQKVMARADPKTVITDIAVILDDEAELFVVKMWRLLIYETEAKKAGLVK